MRGRADWLLVGLVSLALACGGGGTEPPSDGTRTLGIQAGNGQSATVGQAVAMPPAVKVVDGSGSGVAGVSVTFAVTSGGGSGTGLSQTTNDQGVATVGAWTLGTAAGPNTMTATIGGSPVTFTATGTAAAPAAMAKSAGDQQTAPVNTAVTIKPSVTVADQFGNPVGGATVAFAVASGGGTVTGESQTTDASGTATVGDWRLGAAGENTLTASLAGGAVAAVTFTATGQEIIVQPSQDTTFSGGTLQVTSLVIPAGTVVTVAGDLVIEAGGPVDVSGTLQGSCVAIAVNGAETVAISGTIDNQCPTDDPPGADLRIVALGGYDISGAGEITTSGQGVITDDPAVTGPDVTGAAAALRARGFAAAGGCRVTGKAFVAKPIRAKTGASKPHADPGSDASNSWTLWCRGADLTLGAGVRVFGQSGGHGGVGADLNQPAADALGGDGGRGGDITVGSTHQVVFTGPVEVYSGDGGDGGDARGTGLAGQAGDVASSATATGGTGAAPGFVRVVGTTGISGGSNLTVGLGNGGKGGNAEAFGADGEVGKSTTTREQDGGFATATGGAGMGSLDHQLTITGNAAGVPTVSGGNGGKGGDATAVAGTGATAPTEAKPDGGIGGALTAHGGKGGDSEARSAVGALFGDGGMGGFALFKNGNGGHGWNDCEAGNLKPGGAGGAGGAATGGDGPGGTGFFPGDPGNVFADHAGNGGNGGDGEPVGTKGAAGAETGITTLGNRTDTDPVFQDGADGNPCAPPAPEPALAIDVSAITIQHIVTETACPTPSQSITYENTGSTPITVTSTIVGSSLLDLTTGTANGVLQPGEKRTVQVLFNCGQAKSVQATLHVEATTAGNPTPQVIDVPVTVTTQVRALQLAHDTGPFPAGTVIPLAQITGAKRVAAHTPNCATEHVHENSPGSGITIQGQGPFFDPDSTGCGFGAVTLQTLP